MIFANDVFLTLLHIHSIFLFWNPGRSPTLDFLYRSVISHQVMLTDGQHVTRHINMSAKASRTQCAARRALSLPASPSLSSFFIFPKTSVDNSPQGFAMKIKNSILPLFFRTPDNPCPTSRDPAPEPPNPSTRKGAGDNWSLHIGCLLLALALMVLNKLVLNKIST